METQRLHFVLFAMIGFQIITQKISAQSNYHDYSDSQKADIFLDDFNDNWHVWPYIRDGDTWTGKIENGYMHWESKDKSSISQEKIIPLNENLDFEIETSIRYVRGQDNQSNSLDWGGMLMDTIIVLGFRVMASTSSVIMMGSGRMMSPGLRANWSIKPPTIS